MMATRSGRRSTTGWRSWCAGTARRWSSSTRGGWPSGWRATWPSGWARTRSPRTTAACPRAPARRRAAAQGGAAPALVATASLELGIDIGDVDLVCQLGSPRGSRRSCSGWGAPATVSAACPKGRLFPLSRDDLVECAALLDAVRRGELDRDRCPAAAGRAGPAGRGRGGCGEVGEEALYALVHAAPGRTASSRRATSPRCCDARRRLTPPGAGAAAPTCIATGQRRLRRGRGARLTALTNGGAIPDQFDYDVVLQPRASGRHAERGLRLREHARRHLPARQHVVPHPRVETGKVRVEDAQGQPPTIPFWFGEAPGRSDELSAAVSRLRAQVDRTSGRGGEAGGATRMAGAGARAAPAPAAAGGYLATARAALGVLPTQQHLVLERFFDETGDMHLVIHSPFGSASTGPGAWRCASASAASSTSSCRRRRWRTASCCRWARATASRWRRWRAT
jgi:ATP-dependent helicase Lhr and Lhr-like helicase